MPLLVATVAYYMFKVGGKPGTLFYASLGAAVYGIWSSTLFGSGGAGRRSRPIRRGGR